MATNPGKLCVNPRFAKADRQENKRRRVILPVSISNQYDLVIIAAINPYEEMRTALKATYDVKMGSFIGLEFSFPVFHIVQRPCRNVGRYCGRLFQRKFAQDTWNDIVPCFPSSPFHHRLFLFW